MKRLEKFVFLVSIICILEAKDITDELYVFLPFLENIKPPPPCPTNEMYKICKSNCSDCLHRGNCITNGCSSACDCIPHFVRLTPNGPCEPVSKCPKPECGENEVFRECGPICERCTTLQCHTINCDYKCYCKEGYRRNEDGKCIPVQDCPKRQRCSRNEEWVESGPVNEFCLKTENATDDIQNVPQCYCKEGFKRNALGYCVNETLCQYTKCYGVEIYHDCIPKCNTTCRNYGNPNCTEDENCYPGCFCPPGYVMNDFRSCIPVKECSLDIEQTEKEDIPDEEDKDSDTPEIQANPLTAEVEDSVENTTANYFNVTEESVLVTLHNSKPTESCNSCETTVSPAEDSKNLNDEQNSNDDSIDDIDSIDDDDYSVDYDDSIDYDDDNNTTK